MAPTSMILFKSLSALARRLERTFGVVVPELNAGPVLWWTVRKLGLSRTFPLALSLPLAHPIVFPRTFY